MQMVTRSSAVLCLSIVLVHDFTVKSFQLGSFAGGFSSNN